MTKIEKKVSVELTKDDLQMLRYALHRHGIDNLLDTKYAKSVRVLFNEINEVFEANFGKNN